jgi:hypothetical protein
MVRVMAVAAMAGALVGAVALYALTRFDWRGRATEWFVPSSRTAEVSLEPWPICTAMGSMPIKAASGASCARWSRR